MTHGASHWVWKCVKAADNRAVVVGPGYAVDGTGRDILLAESLHVSVPTMLGPEAVVLTARYQEDAAFRDRPDLAALCLCGGLDPRHERPLFAWRLPDEVRFGPEVPLVQVVVEAWRHTGGAGWASAALYAAARPPAHWLGGDRARSDRMAPGGSTSTSDWRSLSTPRRRDSRVFHTISRHCRAISAIGDGEDPLLAAGCMAHGNATHLFPARVEFHHRRRSGAFHVSDHWRPAASVPASDCTLLRQRAASGPLPGSASSPCPGASQLWISGGCSPCPGFPFVCWHH